MPRFESTFRSCPRCAGAAAFCGAPALTASLRSGINVASAGNVKAAVNQNTARSEMYWPQAPISAAPKPLPMAA